VLEETTGSQTTDYVYGSQLIASVQGSSASFYLSDGLGSTAALTDGSGAVTDTYRYDAFGGLRSQLGTSGQPYRFAGQQQDAQVSGQPYYLRARSFDPALGRFWARDPALGAGAQSQSWNPYTYVENNPVNRVDPSGLQSDDEPQPIPAPMSPEEVKEFCQQEAERCRQYALDRGFRDGYQMVCIPLQKECERTQGHFDLSVYIRLPHISLPRTGTGGYLPSKEGGNAFWCGSLQPFASGWGDMVGW
jgi:RHS repeat-associated protein